MIFDLSLLSATTNVFFGVELWIERETVKNFTVSARDMPGKVIVAHSPHSGKSGDDYVMDESYGDLERYFEVAGARGLLFVMDDFNACIGGVRGPAIGGVGAENESCTGRHAESCLTIIVLLP